MDTFDYILIAVCTVMIFLAILVSSNKIVETIQTNTHELQLINQKLKVLTLEENLCKTPSKKGK